TTITQPTSMKVIDNVYYYEISSAEESQFKEGTDGFHTLFQFFFQCIFHGDHSFGVDCTLLCTLYHILHQIKSFFFISGKILEKRENSSDFISFVVR
ncbi:MAG: hypothetical protein IKL30_06540, partial [Anaerotignum sp.]|nr:hypothetical protein [Anaerotignum sp.]